MVPTLHPRSPTETAETRWPWPQPPALLLWAPAPALPSGEPRGGTDLPADEKSRVERSLPLHQAPAPTPPAAAHTPTEAGFPRARTSPGRWVQRPLIPAVAHSGLPGHAQSRTLPRPRPCQSFADLRTEPCALRPFSPLLHRRAEGLGQRRASRGGGPGPGSCPWLLLLTATTQPPGNLFPARVG